MAQRESDPTRPPDPSVCEICSQLGKVETSFYKYGWPEQDRALPAAAHRLVPVEPITPDNENHHLKRCPLCGTLYRYDTWYDYLANGSEDGEELVRLASDEAPQPRQDTHPYAGGQ